jgi:hypothetical protein
MSTLIWSIRFILFWSSERSLGGCVVIDWDVDVWCAWGEGRCRGMGCRLVAWAYVVAVGLGLYLPVVMGLCDICLSRNLRYSCCNCLCKFAGCWSPQFAHLTVSS